MSTSPIGCISPARKWIIVNNCATIHATTQHWHTHTHAPLVSSLVSHSRTHTILPLSFSRTIIIYVWIIIYFIYSSRVYIGWTYIPATIDARYRAADDCSTVCSCTLSLLRFVSSVRLHSAPRGPPAAAPLAPRESPRLRPLWEVIHVALYLSPSYIATGSVALRNLFIFIYLCTDF